MGFTFGGCMPNENNFFNTDTNQCEQFTFGGCMPHQQLTDDKNLIQPKSGELPKKKKKSKKSYDCTEAPFIKGRCRAALNKWSWNPETLKCESFVYSGCDGNSTNFQARRNA